MEKNMHLLIVDDDAEILDLLVKLLKRYNFEVSAAANGEQMWDILDKTHIDLVVLDLMLPNEDGLSLCKKLRQQSSMPVIMLTAAGDETDRIVGLELGADDYIAKPFNPRELVARIKAVLRRSVDQVPEPYSIESQHESRAVEFSGWVLDMGTRQLISPDNVEISISSGEYVLLIAFIEHPQQILSRDQLLDLTQNRHAGPFDRSVDVQVSRLRQKIEADPKKPALIKTVRGGGYLFTARVKAITNHV